MGACPRVSTGLQGPEREPQRAAEWRLLRGLDWFLDRFGGCDRFLRFGTGIRPVSLIPDADLLPP